MHNKMSDIDDIDEKILTPEGSGQYAAALITVQRKEQMPVMAELKAKQEYVKCDDDEKELFRQILSGYTFAADDCLAELDECYMQLTVKKSEAGTGYDISCAFCRESQGKSYWFNISPADYFMIIQIVGTYTPGVVHSFAPYYFFQAETVDIVDSVVNSQMKAKTARKKIKVIR